MADAPALALRSVDFAYPGRPCILRGVDLQVRRGDLAVILGPNGSGKTTLLRLAAGLEQPGRGHVRLADGTRAAEASRRGRIGYIPQHLGLVRHATAFENALAGALRRMPAYRTVFGLYSAVEEDAALAALDAVGLRAKAHEKVCRLSGGERQRVAIARTMVQEPEVIVADELIASLDVVQAHGVLEAQRELRRTGVAILMSLHQVDVALAQADRIAFLQHGALSEPRPPAGMTVEEARCALVA